MDADKLENWAAHHLSEKFSGSNGIPPHAVLFQPDGNGRASPVVFDAGLPDRLKTAILADDAHACALFLPFKGVNLPAAVFQTEEERALHAQTDRFVVIHIATRDGAHRNCVYPVLPGERLGPRFRSRILTSGITDLFADLSPSRTLN